MRVDPPKVQYDESTSIAPFTRQFEPLALSNDAVNIITDPRVSQEETDDQIPSNISIDILEVKAHPSQKLPLTSAKTNIRPLVALG